MISNLQMLLDFFIYSEGNVKGLIICCLISLGSFVLLILTFVFGKKGSKPEKVGKSGKICSKCGKEIEPGSSFCAYCGNKT